MNLREKVLQERFLAPGEVSEFDMYSRVANFLGGYGTEESDEFYNIMAEHKFLPNTPTLVNAGREGSSGQLAACFVLPIEDSMEGIFTSLKHMALIQKTGGGVGYDFSRLRPKDSPVLSSLGTSSGPISFMKAYDAATDTIKQGGIRRGANMGVLRVDHPDIEEFITCKSDLTQLNNFNISVAITDEFMQAVKNNNSFSLRFKDKIYATVNARELFDKICEQAWKTGEPGIMFIDRINDSHPLSERIEATNPCGEQPLLPYEACTLGSINLSNLAYRSQTGEYAFDFEEFRRVITIAVKLLNRVLDKNNYPLEQIKDRVMQNRKIGLGVMGYADLLVKLGITYGSPEAIDLTHSIGKCLRSTAKKASAYLGETEGSFPNKHNSIYKNTKIRNATVTTIAPTGTISILAECSGGIEPIFSPYYFTNRLDSQFLEYHPLFKQMLIERNLLEEFESEIIKYKEDLSKFDLYKFYPEIADLFRDVHQIGVEAHIETQAVWQQYIDNAVSKTINMHADTTVERVRDAYIRAYESGCKGVTVYRDGSRGMGVLTTKQGEESKEIKRDREDWQTGMTTKVSTGCGNIWITINEDSHGNINEVFIRNGDDGGCPNIEGEARLISLALRRGVELEEVLDQLSSVKCSRSIASKRTPAKSCSDAIGRVIKEYVNKRSGKEIEEPEKQESFPLCPNCNEPLTSGSMSEGCIMCKNCGWSQCS